MRNLFLKKKNFTDFIQPIDLPTVGWFRNPSYVGKEIYVAGWGLVNTECKSLIMSYS